MDVFSSNGKKSHKVARECLSNLHRAAGRFSLYLPLYVYKQQTERKSVSHWKGREGPKERGVCLRSSSYTLHCVSQSGAARIKIHFRHRHRFHQHEELGYAGLVCVCVVFLLFAASLSLSQSCLRSISHAVECEAQGGGAFFRGLARRARADKQRPASRQPAEPFIHFIRWKFACGLVTATRAHQQRRQRAPRSCSASCLYGFKLPVRS